MKATPSQEAIHLIRAFCKETETFAQAKRCALIAVDEIIELLKRNKGYTQCTIDLRHYEFVRDLIINDGV